MSFWERVSRTLSTGHHGQKRDHGDRGHQSRSHHAERTYTGDAYNVAEPSGVVCPKCGAGYPVTAKFCSNCGQARLPQACAGCGSALDPTARFCPQCGKSRG